MPFADLFAIPASSVLAYGKYAPRNSPPASLGFDENHGTSETGRYLRRRDTTIAITSTRSSSALGRDARTYVSPLATARPRASMSRS